MDQHTLLLAAVPVTGFFAGFINTLAGSGSLLTLPILILLGLPANIANGTNRVGVTMQNIVAVATFHRRGALPLKGSWKLLVPSVAGLFPVGRLDVTTEGLILLTNDGAFAERVSHPRYEVPRVYHAKVHGVPGAEALEKLRRGVRVDGEFMAVDRARVVDSENNAWVEVTLHEGKQHEVKRLLEAVGHPVSKLRRVAIGPVTSRGLEPGEFRALTQEEIDGLRRARPADAKSIRKVAPHHRPRAQKRSRPGAARASRPFESGRGSRTARRERPAAARGRRP